MCPWTTSHLEVRDGEEAMYSDVIAKIPRRYMWVETFSMFVRSIVPPVHVVGVQVHPLASWGRHTGIFLQEARCVFRVADLLKSEVLLGWQFRVD
jgi:hypothetical protein